MHKTRIDLSEKTRRKVTDLLNARLADAIDLQAQAKHAHWNVKGPSFIALHELFDDIAENIEEHIDTLAERVTALGGTDDHEFVRQMIREVGVSAVPGSSFYSPRELGRTKVRFMFAKRDETLHEAGKRLQKLRGA